MTFRVVTYNIRGALGMDGRRSLERIASVVNALNPDIVCFQEIHRRFLFGTWEDQPRKLAAMTGLRTEFLAAVGISASGFGNAIAARFPVKERRQWLLPSVRERRGCLELVLECEGRALTVFCAHLGLDSRERVRHAETIAGAVREQAQPIIVAGDFNEAIDGSAARTLLETGHLHDAAAESPEPTYPSDAPRSRIDLVLHSRDIVVENTFAAASDASDHLPMVVDFRFA